LRFEIQRKALIGASAFRRDFNHLQESRSGHSNPVNSAYAVSRANIFLPRRQGDQFASNVDAEWHGRNIQDLEIKVSLFLRFLWFLRFLGFSHLSTFQPFLLARSPFHPQIFPLARAENYPRKPQSIFYRKGAKDAKNSNQVFLQRNAHFVGAYCIRPNWVKGVALPVGRIYKRTITITSHSLGKGRRHSCLRLIPSCTMVVVPHPALLRSYGATKGYAELRHLMK